MSGRAEGGQNKEWRCEKTNAKRGCWGCQNLHVLTWFRLFCICNTAWNSSIFHKVVSIKIILGHFLAQLCEKKVVEIREKTFFHQMWQKFFLYCCKFCYLKFWKLFCMRYSSIFFILKRNLIKLSIVLIFWMNLLNFSLKIMSQNDKKNDFFLF